MRKNKNLLFIRKENLLPDFGFFKNINQICWKLMLYSKIPKTISRYSPDTLTIICDRLNKNDFDKEDARLKTFGEYAQFYEHNKRYSESKKMLKKLSEFIDKKGGLCYKSIDLWHVIEEELSWFIIELLYRIGVLERIIKKENPTKAIIPGITTSFGKSLGVVAASRNLDLESYYPKFLEHISNMIANIVKRESLLARFYRIPYVNRREFVKTGNLKKIKVNKRGILILGLDRLYYGRIENVVKEMVKTKSNNIVILTNKINMQKELRERELNFVSFGDFLTKGAIREIGRKNKEIIAFWEKLAKEKEFREIFRYKGYDLWPTLREEIEFIFKVKFKWVMCYIESSIALLKRLKISLVASICDFIAPTRSMVLVANSLSIPTLLVQQGLQVDETGRFFIPLTCRKIAVWGLADKRYMERFGVKCSRIVITGSPLHDTIIAKKTTKNLRENIQKKLGLDKSKKIVLIISQAFENFWGENARGKFIRLAISALQHRKDIEIILKLHPREDKRIPNSIIDDLKPQNVHLIKKEFGIPELLGISDIMITVNSTAIYDAIVENKPVITINLARIPEQAEYVKYGACLGVYKEKDFADAFNSLSKKKVLDKLKKGRRKWLKEHFYKMDGKASKRVAKMINRMIVSENL